VEAVALRPRPKLRVGVFADRRTQPRWVANAFARVACSECAEITIIGHGDAPPARVSWPWRVYGALDASVFGSDADPSQPLELAAQVPHGRTLALPARSAPEAGSWRAEVARLDLDVAFALGDVDEEALCGLARFGVWRFCFGEPPSTECAAPGLREAVEGAPLTSSGLTIRLGNGEGMRAAFQSWSRTYAYSAVRNRDLLLRKTASFALRALRDLHRSGAAWLRRCARIPEAARESAGPSQPCAIRNLAGLGARALRRSLQRAFCVEQWMIGYRFGASPGGGEEDLGEFRRLEPPRDRLWADPFPFYAGGAHYIFFEELPFAAGKAHISMVCVDREGRSSAPVRVLERDYHLSYPFLVVHRGVLYMIPESGQNRTVDLYRCVEFPDRWRLEKTLLQGMACFDATVHRERDRWWMFVNVAEDGAHPDDELHLFHADDLLGDWRPHPRNPIKSDVRCARPAGRLYREGEALIRPAQIGVPLYGSGISLNRVLRLSLQDYAEEEVGRIVPQAGDRVLGLHTLNRAGELSVIDAFMRRARL
jgi:hypothetical protein